MICVIRKDRREVALRHIRLSDVLMMIPLIVMRDKEIVFTKPEEDAEYENNT